MVDLSAVNDILSIRNGVWSLVALFSVGLFRWWSGLPAVMQQFIARRQAIAAEKEAERRDQAAERAMAVQLLREEVSRLAERVKSLEGEAAHWRERANFHEAESIKKQAIIDGHGEVKQASAVAAAEARLAEAERTRRSDGGIPKPQEPR